MARLASVETESSKSEWVHVLVGPSSTMTTERSTVNDSTVGIVVTETKQNPMASASTVSRETRSASSDTTRTAESG